ncbi:hypothetical protein Bbelb_115580 [Branchiostoma belcheri]|nr:hypothetical protein Bbelb_115580 [Branchiostoma belcheri]
MFSSPLWLRIPDGPIGTVGSTVPTEIPFFPSPTGPPEPLERHQTSAQSLSTAASCPKDYTEFRGICYKKSKIPKAFSEAAVACIEDGGNLAMPKDADSNAFLKTLHVLQGDYLWIGLHDRPEEGSFQWMDGTPLGEFTSWGPGQPDGTSGSEDCVTWAHVGGRSAWNDYECLHDFLFVCQVIPALPRIGSPSGLRPSGDPTRGRAAVQRWRPPSRSIVEQSEPRSCSVALGQARRPELEHKPSQALTYLSYKEEVM